MALNKIVAAAVLAALPLAVTPAAAAVRPGMVALPAVSADTAVVSRASTRMDKKSSIFGAPIALLVLGGAAAAAAAVAVASSGSSSPN